MSDGYGACGACPVRWNPGRCLSCWAAAEDEAVQTQLLAGANAKAVRVYKLWEDCQLTASAGSLYVMSLEEVI